MCIYLYLGNPSLHPGTFDLKYGSLAALKEAVDGIHKRGVAVLLEVRWDYFTSLTPIATYQEFNEENTTIDSRLATLVHPSPSSNTNSTQENEMRDGDIHGNGCDQHYIEFPPTQTTNSRSNSGSGGNRHASEEYRLYISEHASSQSGNKGNNGNNNDGNDGNRSDSKRYCIHHAGNITSSSSSSNRSSYFLNLRPGSPVRVLLRQLFYHLYHDYHIDGLYWSETECAIGIGSEGCVNGTFTEMEKKWMEEVMEEARTIGLVQVRKGL